MKLFGTSGIRGEYGKSITEELAKKIGRAIGCITDSKVIIATDTRLSGPSLKKALISTLRKTNDIIDLGIAPTPVAAFACKKYKSHGIVITASHNPKEYNGFKVLGENGLAYSSEKEKELEKVIEEGKICVRIKNCDTIPVDISEEYKDAIIKQIKLKGGKKVLIDAGNGAASIISPALLEKYGYEVIKVNCNFDGSFPNRMPEPSKENLQKTAKLVAENKCNIGFCHDGDADRMIAIDENGNVVDFDAFLAFLCKNMAEENKNKSVATTVDASRAVDDHLKGVRIIRSKVGDVDLANDVHMHDACFGGEPSGSYIFPEFGLWPDGIYAIFKTLKFLEKDGRKLSEILSAIPRYNFTRIKIACPNNKKEKVISAIKIPKGCKIIRKDGIMMVFNDVTILIRPSGTEEYIRINVEAKEERILKEKLDFWKEEIESLINQI